MPYRRRNALRPHCGQRLAVSVPRSRSTERSSWLSVAFSTLVIPSLRFSHALISRWLRAIPACELGDEPVALAAQHRAALERRHLRPAVAVPGAARQRARVRPLCGVTGPRAARSARVRTASSAARRRRSEARTRAPRRARSRGALAGRARPASSASCPCRRACRSSCSTVAAWSRRTGSAGMYSQLGSAGRPGIVRTNRPTIWRNTSGVLAAVAYTPTRSRGMSTPSETMLTATIHGSRECVNAASFAAARGLGVEDHQRRPDRSPRAAAPRSGAHARVGGDHETAGVAMARRAQTRAASRRPRAGSAAARRAARSRSPSGSGGSPRASRAPSRSSTRSRHRRCARTASRRRRRSTPAGRRRPARPRHTCRRHRARPAPRRRS